MKKRILSLLLIMAMGISFLVGCGSSGTNTGTGSNSGTNSNTENNQKEESTKTTVSYNATDYQDNTVICEFTYDTSVISLQEEPVNDLSADGVIFRHIETDIRGNITFCPEYYSAGLYYENEKANVWIDEGEEVIFSELKKEKIGSIEFASYTKKHVWEGGNTLEYQYGLFQFKEGIIRIEAQGTDAESADIFRNFLETVTVNGKEPNTPSYAYKLYDCFTNEPLYIVSYDPTVFAVDEYSGGNEMILNYLDTSLEYTQMIIRVNEYASGMEYFSSKSNYLGKISYEVGEDGKIIETEGKIGDATVYLGFGNNQKRNEHGYLFFAEMPDGNVITGHVPNADPRETLDIMKAFVSILPIE